jgi:hypothetical protein
MDRDLMLEERFQMTSRRTLWTSLGLAALPLLFEASMGCNAIFNLEETRPVLDNKLSCSCECKPTTPDPIVSLRVVAKSDDAEQAGASMDLFSSTLDLGQSKVGLRFESLKIPQGASILSAIVRFNANGNDAETTDLMIYAEASAFPATFSSTDNDLTGRTVGSPLLWTSVPEWISGDAAAAQETPDLSGLLQPLVDQPGWTDASSFLLRLEGTGHRRARSRDDSSTRAPLLEVKYTTGVAATLPVCASPDVDRSGGSITAQGLVDECLRVEATLEGLAAPCGYPTDCSCTPDSVAGTSDVATCKSACPEVLVDATCTNFDPNAFERCMQEEKSIEACKHFVTATNASGDSQVCVPSGSALAFHAFGSRSLCEVEGTSQIQIGDREPQQDPETTGIVEFLARPCPGGGCSVHPYFDLQMEPITFSVRWASDPTFSDLSASGRGLEPAVHSGGELSYAPDGVEGTGNGRRGLTSLAIDAMNAEPLDFGIDWDARLCDMNGSIAGGAGDDGICAGDGATPCAADSPDCDGVGGPCQLPPDAESMEVNVSLAGEIVNQPPTAAAGADQSVECTSSAGASFVLDGRGSSDPDQNLALASWREGSRVGPLIVNGLNAELSLGLDASQSYVLRVIDAFAQTDEDQTRIEVVDTTPPVITCNAPATIRPPNATISFAATATDTCDPSVAAQVTGYDCFAFTKKGKRISKLESCIVSFTGDTLSITDVGGYGDRVRWTVEARDDHGRLGKATCEVLVRK